MIAKFNCGPYDGIELDHNDMRLYAGFQPVGTRKFVIMPPFDQWDAVRRGEVEKDDVKGMRLVYELVRTPTGAVATFDSDGSVFVKALNDEREGRGPAFVPRPFTGAYYQCVRGEWALPPAGRVSVTDEKGRKWACLKISNKEGERPDLFAPVADLMKAHDAAGTDERFQVSTHHCESAHELPAKLADLID